MLNGSSTQSVLLKVNFSSQTLLVTTLWSSIWGPIPESWQKGVSLCVKTGSGQILLKPWGAARCLFKTTPGRRVSVQSFADTRLRLGWRQTKISVTFEIKRTWLIARRNSCLHLQECSLGYAEVWADSSCCPTVTSSVTDCFLSVLSVCLSVSAGMARLCPRRPSWIKPPTNVKVS